MNKILTKHCLCSNWFIRYIYIYIYIYIFVFCVLRSVFYILWFVCFVLCEFCFVILLFFTHLALSDVPPFKIS